MLVDNKLDDNELYDLLKQDNETAFALLYRRYWKRLLYKALLKLDSETDAEEIVQDTFIDLWNSRHRITIEYSLNTYISSIVRYKIMAKMAANKKVVHDNMEDLRQLQIADNSTEQWLSYFDLRAEIETAITALPEKCQLIFRMSRETGMSNNQIANKLEISPKTVEAHISRALKSLRTSLGQFLTFLSVIFALICHL
ncbi:MAG: polymerase sigma-70 factor [Mucilaginibacter sp.]|nr:polymerase sigma-70 factor [Mucilaginibacter sp.]